MKPVSVLIPTANRPVYLKTALQSVVRQTAVQEIEEVLVSENLGNRASEEVCSQFPNLPIRYIFRDPFLTNEDHIHDLFLEAKADYVALLCDDDWWTTGHLHTALSALYNQPLASSWFSGCIHIGSESERHNLWIWRHPAFWVAAGMQSFTELWQLSLRQVLATTWIVTPFSFSTMVAHREALRSAAQLMVGCHPFYADRILYPGLASCGDILYDPIPSLFARWHSGNWSKDKEAADLDKAYKEGSVKIHKFSLEKGLDPGKYWRECLPTMPEEVANEVSEQIYSSLGQEGVVQNGLAQYLPHPKPRLPILKRIRRRIYHELLKGANVR